MTARGGIQRTATPAEREQAVELYRELGPSETARRTGWSKASVSNWAKKAGAMTASPEAIMEVVAHREARRQLSMVEWREELTELLRSNSLMAAQLEHERLSQTGIDAPSLPHVTAVRKQATSDLLLLSGEPTSRSASLQELPAIQSNVARLRDELAVRRTQKEL